MYTTFAIKTHETARHPHLPPPPVILHLLYNMHYGIALIKVMNPIGSIDSNINLFSESVVT